jgi:hypothetical protein
VSELLSSTVKVPHGALVYSSVEITLLSHDLGPKDFYPRREKCGLEGMT